MLSKRSWLASKSDNVLHRAGTRASSCALTDRFQPSVRYRSTTSSNRRLPRCSYLHLSAAPKRGVKTVTRCSFSDLPQGLVLQSQLASQEERKKGSKRASKEKSAEVEVAEPTKQVKCKTKRKKKASSEAKDTKGGLLEDVRGQDAEEMVAGNTSEALSDLPSDSSLYPTVIQQAKENMAKYSNCVVLTRVGNFYELYFEQAEEYSSLLGLKLARKKTSVGPVSMSGFPYFQLDRYLKILVQNLHKFVAIADEYSLTPSERTKSGGLMFDRRITRIISPGTLIDEAFINPLENNYILGVSSPGDSDGTTVGLAWLDLSSGHFFLQSVPSVQLVSTIEVIGPKEIIVDRKYQLANPPWLASLLEDKGLLISFLDSPDTPAPEIDQWDTLADFVVSKPMGFKQIDQDPEFTKTEVSVGFFLLQYLRTRLLETSPHLRRPQKRQTGQFMYIDKPTLRALEVKTTLRDNLFEGTLLHSVLKTVTKSGTRLLSQRLVSPSMDFDEITRRLDMVSLMVKHSPFREKLISFLKQMADLPRVVQKFAFGRGDADDLIDLARSIRVCENIAESVRAHEALVSSSEKGGEQLGGKSPLSILYEQMELDGPRELAAAILDSIDEDMLAQRNMAEENEVANLLSSSDDAPEDFDLQPVKQIAKPAKIKGLQESRLLVQQGNGIGSGNAALIGSEIWIMRRDANPSLKRLHKHLDSLVSERQKLETKLREEFSIASLTLKWSPGLGHICHIKGKDATNLTAEKLLQIDPGSRLIGSSRSTKSFILPEWTSLGIRTDEAKMRIRAAEQELFQDLRKMVVSNLPKLHINSAILDEIDIACGFARLAVERNLVRPVMINDGANAGASGCALHDVRDGRHMMVERGLMSKGRLFTSNDCLVQGRDLRSPDPAPPSPSPSSSSSSSDTAAESSSPSSSSSSSSSSSPVSPPIGPQILLITGPNMAGKSTFLRQNAIISLLAQSGSFVPATSARLGIVDQLFARVGSADNLYANQSTFMVEMLETAAILGRAGPRSLVVMDEVGRGTTPRDGLAIAFATLVHLAKVNGSKVLFATHFTELVDALEKSDLGTRPSSGSGSGSGSASVVASPSPSPSPKPPPPLIKYLCTGIVETDGGKSWGFVHRMREGVSSGSHALKVAKMAGIPDSAIQIASKLLLELDARENQ